MSRLPVPCRVCHAPIDARLKRRFCSKECRGKHQFSVNLQRFHDRIKKDDASGCWLWQGTISKAGYGVTPRPILSGKAQSVYAHRLAYELAYGEIPQGLYVCHKCDVRNCVNPEHFFLGTHLENIEDMKRKGRGHFVPPPKHQRARGENARSAKLTEAQVIEIRRAFAAQEKTMAGIARDYELSHPTVSSIVRRLTWKHIP